MSKRITSTFILTIMLWSISAVCADAQQLASLTALTKGKGTMVANGQDKYKLTGVLVILKENGDAQITLYADIQISAQGRWSKTKDPKVINFKISGGLEGDDSRVKGKFILSEDGKSIASLTAQGAGMSGVKYEINFVADQKDPAKP
ncbi:MAG: hypothetical protein AABM67_15360 [Acidobacteriota bacterium]